MLLLLVQSILPDLQRTGVALKRDNVTLEHEILLRNVKMKVEATRTEAIMDAFHFPIDSNVFSVVATEPQVNVQVAGMNAQCRAEDGCTYVATAESTPEISSIIVAGVEVTVEGSGFGSMVPMPGGRNAVEVGSMACGVMEHADTKIVCELPGTPLPGSNEVKVSAKLCSLLACHKI